MHHRFFLVAPGDFVTTPKLAEAVAMGGAGGPGAGQGRGLDLIGFDAS